MIESEELSIHVWGRNGRVRLIETCHECLVWVSSIAEGRKGRRRELLVKYLRLFACQRCLPNGEGYRRMNIIGKRGVGSVGSVGEYLFALVLFEDTLLLLLLLLLLLQH